MPRRRDMRNFTSALLGDGVWFVDADASCSLEEARNLERPLCIRPPTCASRTPCSSRRLGEPDKAINYLKQSSKDSTSADISRAQSVKSRIAKCNDAMLLCNRAACHAEDVKKALTEVEAKVKSQRN